MSKFFEKVLRPTLFKMDAERAHDLGLKALGSGLVPKARLTWEELEHIADVFVKLGTVYDRICADGREVVSIQCDVENAV